MYGASDKAKAKGVSEYEDIDYEALSEIPDCEFFRQKNAKHPKKQILVIDDIDIKKVSKQELLNIGKIVSFASSHYQMSIIIACQDVFHQINPDIIRFCNVYIAFPYPSVSYRKMLFNRFGYQGDDCDMILDEMKSYGLHDNLTIDLTENSPCKYRKNLYEKVLQSLY